MNSPHLQPFSQSCQKGVKILWVKLFIELYLFLIYNNGNYYSWRVSIILLYNKFSDYLKNKYGTKVYKLPVNIPCTCPNRDGTVGTNGCIFCGGEGAGFETLSNSMNIRQQLEINMAYIREKYNAKKFIVYFQSYSSTYLDFEEFKKYISESIIDDICAVYISTRPDCISDEQLGFLKDIQDSEKVDIVIELGLQSSNDDTLKILNRGHSVADFINTVKRIKQGGLDVCAHYIIDLPWDDVNDVIKGAALLSSLSVSQVKIHSLYILENTQLGIMYRNKQFSPLSLDSYINRVITFLEYLSPGITIQRLIGRAPKERTLFCNWGMSWWKIRDLIEEEMKKGNTYQGKKQADPSL